jgi:HD-GYP domain-containing protein (c-di-GMP phosphodiesterase class II)
MSMQTAGLERGVASQRRAGGDRGLQAAGRDLLFAIQASLRGLKLYPLENQTVQNALRELQAISERILRSEGEIALKFIGELCFVNDLRLRIDLATYATFGTVAAALRGHGLGEIAVESEVEVQDWTRFLSLLLHEPGAEDPFGTFLERADRSGLTHIAGRPAVETGLDASDVDSDREAAKRTYAQSVAVAREVMTGMRLGRSVSLRRVKRAVQSIVDQVLNNETSIVGMAALKDYDEYTFAHSVNVCIFSIALGKRLGLTKHQLYELGLGALLHDVGKLQMPLEITNKTAQLTDEEWDVVKEHPTEGLLALFEMRGFSELPLRAMLLAYEHHMKVDQTGYPRSVRPRSPTLFSRIVAVADGFDAATSSRSYQTDPFPPDHVLREMRDNPARGQDQLLVKAFISMTGIYPVGTLVILDTFELAVVVARSQRPDQVHRPIVKVIYDDMGIPLEPPTVLDLGEDAPETGAPRRTIIKTTDPERYGIHVGDYLL